MRFIYSILTIASVAFFSSCDKGLLGELPVDKTQAIDVFKDSLKVDQYLLGCYTFLPSGFDRFDNQSMLSSATDESTQCKTDNGVKALVDGSLSPVSNPDSGWAKYYEGIMNVNLLLENIHLLKEGTPEGFIRRTIAEARFLRAYFHFELVKRYGGIPIVKRTFTANDDTNIPRDTYENCVKFITEELTAAATDLPLTRTDSEMGRASGIAAKALKARMLLYAASPLFNGGAIGGAPLTGYETYDRTRWEAAAQAAKDVLDHYGDYPSKGAVNTVPAGTIALYGNMNNQENIFRDLFLKPGEGKGNKELIFVRTRARDNQLEKAMTPPTVTNGLGGVSPSQNLAEAFEWVNNNNANNALTVDPTIANPTNQNPYVAARRDQRFYSTFNFNTKKTFNGTLTFETFLGGKHAEDSNINATKTGYYLRKFLDPTALISGNQTQATHYFPLIRVGDVLLMYAEAMNEAYGPEDDHFGTGRTALWAVNEIRKRVNMPLRTTGATEQEMREFIIHERRIELAFEEHRFWDIRRWKIAGPTQGNTPGYDNNRGVMNQPLRKIVINKSGAKLTYEYPTETVEVRAPWEDKMYLYPIPRSEMYRNRALVQNPGWN